MDILTIRHLMAVTPPSVSDFRLDLTIRHPITRITRITVTIGPITDIIPIIRTIIGGRTIPEDTAIMEGMAITEGIRGTTDPILTAPTGVTLVFRNLIIHRVKAAHARSDDGIRDIYFKHDPLK